MKTKWGRCSIAAGRSWLNSELARMPLRCIEYIVMHELAHLLDWVMPQWQQNRPELNQMPLGHEEW